MTPHDRRVAVDLLAARYLEALERDDFDTLNALWEQAATDPDLFAALRELHAALEEERQQSETNQTTAAVAAAVEKHMPSAQIARPAAGPVTVADVANDLFRHTPDRLPAAAHALNERLRGSSEILPTNLGLRKLIEWAEAKFGPTPADYWKAFRESALTLELVRDANVDYRLAARKAPPTPGGPQ